MEKKKMSKSEDSDYSRIDLKDTEDEIKKRLKKQKPIPYQFLKNLQI